MTGQRSHRSVILHFQVSEIEAKRLERRAKELGINLSTLLRQLVGERQRDDEVVRIPLIEWRGLLDLVKRIKQSSSSVP